MRKKNTLVLCVLAVMVVFGLATAPVLVEAATATTSASVGNSLPTASSASLNEGSAITLTANTTTAVVGTVTITDNNGYEDITSVSGLLYRTDVGGGAADDNQNHYTVSCSSNGDGSGTTETYNCTFNVEHYADATDAGTHSGTTWTFNATPSDGTGAGTADTDARELNTLQALSLETTTIAFGSMNLGDNTTTTNQNTTIANHGNVQLDVNIDGYGGSDGDGLSMNCTTGNITVGNLEYSHSSFTYGAGTNLSDSATEIDLDVVQGSEGTPRPNKSIYYGFEMPETSVSGTCSGTVQITGISDSGMD